MKQKHEGNHKGEKVFRYSIRKYHFGAASVAVAALMFFANGTVQAQTPEISPATESGTTRTSALVSDSSGGVSEELSEKTPDTDPSQPEPSKQGNQENQEVSNKNKSLVKDSEEGKGEKQAEVNRPTVDKSLAESAQTSLQALLANLTLDSMKELHARVEAGLAQAKAVLENPNSSQEEVNAQVQAMKTLTEEVNKALAGGLTSPADLGEGRSATQSEPSSSPRRGRRGRKPQTPPTAPVENQETKETAEEATDYTNGSGSYPLSDKIHKLLQELKTSTENPEQVQKLKESYDKLNEALGQSDNGLVDDAVFNAALEEYKKAAHLKKDEEGTGGTRSRRSVSGLVYGLATGSPGSEKRYRNRDGSEKDSVALLNSSDLDDAPLKFIATVENGGIREFSLKGFPETDASGRKWATTTVTYSGDRKRAIIKVTGKTPKSIYGLYNVTPQVTLDSGNVQSKLQQIRYQLPKAEFDLSPTGSGHTAQQDAEGKAKATGNDRPIFQVKIPTPPGGRIKSTNIPAKGQIKVFLVRGGSNQKFGNTETSATGYDIVAWALIGELGTGYIVPPQYKKESIGDQTLRLVTAYVQQNTENIVSDDFVSPLSTDSITPTNPIDRDGAKQTLTQKATDKKNG
ncbi:YSIRK-type signal peptide-containing protein, partial [Streptococcus pneumoniae]|uniref:YSIRK-type signal peptide-containing protein n=1 Tax=Streptococcus pseudopneumoniae TaxID=257758 RepID=UPI003128D84D